MVEKSSLPAENDLVLDPVRLRWLRAGEEPALRIRPPRLPFIGDSLSSDYRDVAHDWDD